MREDVKAFWDSRAQLGEAAGTNDVILKRLEIAKLLQVVPEGSSVLDVGCGNGITLNALCRERKCSGVGLDVSPQMVEAASSTYGTKFRVANIADPKSVIAVLGGKTFDVAVSERCLINLESIEEQLLAFEVTMGRLKPGGWYFMIENSVDGLARLNQLRVMVGLSEMKSPWHNLYLSESFVRRWEWGSNRLMYEESFTSTYYFLSRVVNARLSANEGKEPGYESPINSLSLQLPAIGNCGATRLWAWQRQ